MSGARKTKVSEQGERPKTPLPLPEPLVRHHGATFFGPMREWRERGQIPPVLLLTGLDGVGKRSVAHFLAQWALCSQSGFGRKENAGGDLFGGAPAPAPVSVSAEPLPCGECPSCHRALASNWVDFTEIRPEEEGEALKIDQFRKLKATMGFGAHEGPVRITLISGADRMTPQAANSLLKLLEEPPPGWVLLLTASDPTLVLPTVLSRCQRIRLKPLEAETITELLISAGIAAERAQLCARLASGSWGKALKLAGDEAWEKRGEVLAFLTTPAAALHGLVDWATARPTHFDVLLDQLESLLADLLRAGASAEAPSWRNTDAARALAAHAERAAQRFGGAAGARAFWAARAERIGRARREALAPLNRKLLIQDVLMPWLEL